MKDRRRSARTFKARAGDVVDQWCTEFEQRCRERGVRVTPQRLAVYRAVAADTGHPTAESVYARLRTEMSSLSLATVYRILEFLEAEGLVRRVSTTNSAGRFDANLSRHQHLVCRICGRMTDYEQVPLAQLQLSQIAPSGFEVEELDIRLLGRCEPCKSAASTGRRIQPKSQYR